MVVNFEYNWFNHFERSCTMDEFNRLTATETAQLLRTGEWSLETYLDQAQAYFRKREPEILAFMPEGNRFERLRKDAKALMEKYPEPTERPPLFGVLLGVKDIFHVDGFPTSGGSKLPPAVIGGAEAPSVTRLRQAGALILGKTVTTEFAYFAPGPTKNPHHPEHTPGGSSSGSAAAVGGGLVPLAFGTQTIGSINRPAAFCGVVGYKPSYNRIDKSGVIPLSLSLDHVGLFAQMVTDIALVTPLLADGWREELTVPEKPIFGVPVGPYLSQAEPQGLAHYEEICRMIEDHGFTVKRVTLLENFEEIRTQHNLLMAADAARFHQPWFAVYQQLYHQKTSELIQTGSTYSAIQVQKALTFREELRATVLQTMQEHQIDLWITPSAPGPAPKGLESTGNPVMNLPWTNIGLPTLTIPTGIVDDKLPLGTQLVAAWWADENLLFWGQEFQHRFGVHLTRT
jgi:Asp-tRNA(Asn)/Glu-tRNA(Gln) amidotransferase A subunit family amidase